MSVPSHIGLSGAVSRDRADFAACVCGNPAPPHYGLDSDAENFYFRLACIHCSLSTEIVTYPRALQETYSIRDEWAHFARYWNQTVAAARHSEPPEETLRNHALTDLDAAALLNAKRHLAAGYEVMNAYAKGDLRNWYGRDADASAVMAEAYARIAPAVRFIDEVLVGVEPKMVMSRLADYVSGELAQERDDLETTRANLADEHTARMEELAVERETLHRMIDDEVERRLAIVLEERDRAAAMVRRGARSRKVGV